MNAANTAPSEGPKDVARRAGRAVAVLLVTICAGCRCTPPQSEVEGQTFTRCAAADPPAARSFRAGALSLTVRERLLEIAGPRPLHIAAFTGPVGAAFEPADLAQLERARPELALYLGGLGDDEQTATKNLSGLAALAIPTLFVAGGADRLPVIEAAFAGLAAPARDYMVNASGLRELRIGAERFAIVPGAPFGRYALDERACGFVAEDLEALRRAWTELGSAQEGQAGSEANRGHTWLLSWHAPAGFGVSEGYGDTELGSPDLKALAEALGAAGGLYAYPEGHEAPRAPLAWVVPRLGRVGSRRVDGSRMAAHLAGLSLDERGLAAAP